MSIRRKKVRVPTVADGTQKQSDRTDMSRVHKTSVKSIIGKHHIFRVGCAGQQEFKGKLITFDLLHKSRKDVA